MTETRFTWDVWILTFPAGIGNSWKVDKLLIPEYSTSKLSNYPKIPLGHRAFTLSKFSYLGPMFTTILFILLEWINITWVLKSHYFTYNSGTCVNVHNLLRREPGTLHKLAVVAVLLSPLIQTRHCGKAVQTLTMGYCQLVHIPVVTEVFQERQLQ